MKPANLLLLMKVFVYVLLAAILIAAGLVVNSFVNPRKSSVPRTEAERSIMVAEKAVKSDPNDPLARGNLAAAYLAVGRYSDALKQAQYTMRLNPDEGTGYLVAGIAQRELGKYDSAIEYLKKALQDKNKTSDWYLRVHIELATTYEAKKDYKNAKESLDNAIGSFPEAADLYYERAKLTEKLGDLKGALEDYKAVLVFIPDDKKAQEAVARLEKTLSKEKTTKETTPSKNK